MPLASDSIIRVGDTITEQFFVLDNVTGNAKTGATFTQQFARGPETFTPVYSEIGTGEYAVSFTPGTIGTYRIKFTCNETLEQFFATWAVVASSARTDEPFALRVGQISRNYFSLTAPNGTPATGVSFTRRYTRDPNNAIISATYPGGSGGDPAWVASGGFYTLAEVSLGEYVLTFTPALNGSYRAVFTAGGFICEVDAEVLPGYTTSASNMTLLAIRNAVADRLGDLYSGTFTTGSASVPADTVRSEPDHEFDGGTLYITTGSAAGLSSRVATYTGTTDVFTLSPALAVAPAVGDGYTLHKLWSVDQYNRAIAMAERVLIHHTLTQLTDETTDLATNQWEYPVPAGFNYVARLEVQDGSQDGLFWELGPATWKPLLAPGDNPKVKITRGTWEKFSRSGRALRFVGQAFGTMLSSDGDTTTIPPAVVIPLACAYLLELKSQGPQDLEGRQQRAQQYFQEAMGMKADMHPAPGFLAGSRRVRP
jgi:hypothetical protein